MLVYSKRTLLAPTSCIGIWSASPTIACRFLRISRSVKTGRFSASSTSNQSAGRQINEHPAASASPCERNENRATYRTARGAIQRCAETLGASPSYNPAICGANLDVRLRSFWKEEWRTSVGIRAVPKSLVYWSISSGVPRTESASRMPARRSCMNPSDDTIKEAARGSCWPRSGVGSFLCNVEAMSVGCRCSVAPQCLLEDEERVQGKDDWIGV